MKLVSEGRYGNIYRSDDRILKHTSLKKEALLAEQIKSLRHPMLPHVYDVRHFGLYWIIEREDLSDVKEYCCDFRQIWCRLNFSPKRIRKDREKMLEFSKRNRNLKDHLHCHFDVLLDFYIWLHEQGITIRDLGYKNWGLRPNGQYVVRDFGDCDIIEV